MLVIARKIGESLKIGNDIVITITNTSEHAAKLGIDAPKNVTILKEEFCQQRHYDIKE